MPNSNTIVSMPGTVASGNVTAETAFGLSGAATTRAFTPSIPIPANSLDGHEMELRLGIIATTGTSSTYGPSIRLYSGGNTALTTFTNDTAIITPAAPTLATTTKLITITGRVSWDISTGHLNGYYMMTVDATFTTWAALTAGLTSGVSTQNLIRFCVTGIFGSSNGSNTAVLKYFEIDLV